MAQCDDGYSSKSNQSLISGLATGRRNYKMILLLAVSFMISSTILFNATNTKEPPILKSESPLKDLAYSNEKEIDFNLHNSSSHNVNRALGFLKAKTNSDNLVPKIIHQMYSNYDAAWAKYKTNMESFSKQNPDHLYLLWGDDELDIFVKEFYPILYSRYKALPLVVLKSDLARYMLLNTFGGLYSDMDTVLLKPIDTWFDRKSSKTIGFVAGVEADALVGWQGKFPSSFQLCQWTMASKAGHPILKSVIRTAFDLIRYEKDIRVERVLYLTGPVPWTNTILDHLELLNVTTSNLRELQTGAQFGDVMILPLTAFSPVQHPWMGSKPESHPESKVRHQFHGSWKYD